MRSRTLRLLLVLAGVFILTAAFAPRANAELVAYWNFNDAVLGGTPDFFSDSPGLLVGVELENDYDPTGYEAVAGLALNIAPGDPEPAGLGLGLSRSGLNDPANFFFHVDTTFFADMSLSLAINNSGNGFNTVTFQYSINGGVNFIDFGVATIETGPGQIISFPVPAGAEGQPDVIFQLHFTGGQSQGTNLQNTIDNIQLGGTIIPEPATVVGGLLGVLGLGWHQRRRLIRSVRWRRA